MKTFTILGIDQSYTSTGMVVMNKSKDVLRMEIVATSKRSSDKIDIFHRAREIVRRIKNVVQEFDVDVVSIEQLAYGASGDATRNLAGLQFMIINMLIDLDIPFDMVPPTTLKKYATGKGNCGKEPMVEHLPTGVKEKIESYPKTKGRYDLADAYWLACRGVDFHEF